MTVSDLKKSNTDELLTNEIDRAKSWELYTELTFNSGHIQKRSTFQYSPTFLVPPTFTLTTFSTNLYSPKTPKLSDKLFKRIQY